MGKTRGRQAARPVRGLQRVLSSAQTDGQVDDADEADNKDGEYDADENVRVQAEEECGA